MEDFCGARTRLSSVSKIKFFISFGRPLVGMHAVHAPTYYLGILKKESVIFSWGRYRFWREKHVRALVCHVDLLVAENQIVEVSQTDEETAGLREREKDVGFERTDVVLVAVVVGVAAAPRRLVDAILTPFGSSTGCCELHTTQKWATEVNCR